MSIKPKDKYSIEEYLALESQSEIRHEYWNGEIFEMTGASPEHNQITSNVSRSFGNQLDDRPCSVFISDMRVKTPSTGLYTYPDILIACGEQQYETIEGVKTLLNPQTIIEVFSPSTKNYDQGGKFTHYRSIETLEEYLLIAQDEPHVMLYVKQANGNWVLSETRDLNGRIHLPVIDCLLLLKDIYKRVEL
jgi:Uma2 family endonuclease